ncbi:MAG: MBL fold metallo-hydrolase [Chromatiales bacterium]|nr:MAG: MBL fold metallo-hydrolase [Chromatiales bacterium]
MRAERPSDGELLPVAPGVNWLRMPLPFVLNHINLWLLEDGDGWCIVDTGIAAQTTEALWDKLLTGELADRPVTRVIATHLHPDHVGMAGWLTERTGARLLMTRSEYLSARLLVTDEPPPPPENLAFYRAAGMNDAQLESYAGGYGIYRKIVSPLPLSYQRIEASDVLQIGRHSWQVLIGRGHSPEHACLYCAELGLLIAGDQALPTISPNVSIWPTEPGANPLQDWLESCRELPAQLPGDVLVLPAHGRLYTGLGVRMAQLIDEHEQALDAARAACAEPRRAVDLFDALFRGAVNGGNRIMATGESIAHLAYLEAAGELQAHTDDGGVRWYQRS